MLLTIREVAKRLGVSDSLVRRLIRGGELMAVRVGFGGGRLRVLPDDLEAYVASRRFGREEPEPASPGRIVLRHVTVRTAVP